MKTRYRLYILAWLLLGCWGCQSTPSAEQGEAEAKPQNLLMIVVDDLNDYPRFFAGHEQSVTPNIDRLAASGVSFINAHCTAPVCSPSRNSFLTGVYPHDSRDFGWTPHFKHAVLKHNKTIFELLKENGFSTYGTGKLLHANVRKYWDDWGVKEHYNYGPNLANGDQVVGHPAVPYPFRSINRVDGSFAPLTSRTALNGSADTSDYHWVYSWKKDDFRYENDADRSPMPDEMHVDWVRQKMREITKDTSDKPFFLGVGFVKPHTPLYAPQRYFDMFPLDKIKLPEIKEGDLDDTGYESVYAPSEMGLKYYRRLKESYPGDEGLKRFLQAYLACLAFVDDQIGGVLDALEEHGLAENTTVIFTSDHGWQMGEKDYLYKNSLWDESTRVPFIIKRPDTEPRQITHAVSLIDVFPTVVDLFGLAGGHSKGEKAASLGGHSLVPFLEGEPDNWQGPDGALTIAGAWINKPIEGIGKAKNPHAPWHITISQDLDTGYVRKQHFSYRTERYRYIRYGNGQEELYDHQNDPLEWTNQAQNPDYEAIRSSLHQEMMALINPKAK